MNKLVYGRIWSPEHIRDFRHFVAIAKGFEPDVTAEEIEEAYTLLTGKEIKQSKPSKNIKS
jgi:hypothetical protein